jgi:hypothetical protein
MADDFKYHIEQHGSLVRPPSLLAARSGGLTGDDLAAMEEDAIIGTAHLQRRLTLSMVGDGQFRRSSFESVVYDHVSGFSQVPGPAPLADAAGIPASRRRRVVAGRESLAGALAGSGVDVDAVLAAMISADRAAVTGLAVPEDFRVGLDLTDAGPLPTTSRGYDPVAVSTLLDSTPFNRLCVDSPSTVPPGCHWNWSSPVS